MTQADYTSTPPAFYTQDRVHRLLVSWPELVALSESPGSAHGLLRPGPTPIEPRIGRTRGAPSDPMRFADIVADLQRAHSQLTSGGIGTAAIAACMLGIRPSIYAREAGCRKADTLGLYHQAVAKMARILDPGASSTGVPPEC